MKIIDKGRVCIIKKGRDFGKVVMITGIDKENIVEIDGPKMKKRKINMFHLWPMDKVVKNVEEVKEIKL